MTVQHVLLVKLEENYQTVIVQLDNTTIILMIHFVIHVMKFVKNVLELLLIVQFVLETEKQVQIVLVHMEP